MAFRPKGTNRPSRSYDELCHYCKALKDENKKLKTMLLNPPPEPKVRKFVPQPPKAG